MRKAKARCGKVPLMLAEGKNHVAQLYERYIRQVRTRSMLVCMPADTSDGFVEGFFRLSNVDGAREGPQTEGKRRDHVAYDWYYRTLNSTL